MRHFVKTSVIVMGWMLLLISCGGAPPVETELKVDAGADSFALWEQGLEKAETNEYAAAVKLIASARKKANANGEAVLKYDIALAHMAFLQKKYKDALEQYQVVVAAKDIDSGDKAELEAEIQRIEDAGSEVTGRSLAGQWKRKTLAIVRAERAVHQENYSAAYQNYDKAYQYGSDYRLLFESALAASKAENWNYAYSKFKEYLAVGGSSVSRDMAYRVAAEIERIYTVLKKDEAPVTNRSLADEIYAERRGEELPDELPPSMREDALARSDAKPADAQTDTGDDGSSLGAELPDTDAESGQRSGEMVAVLTEENKKAEEADRKADKEAAEKVARLKAEEESKRLEHEQAEEEARKKAEQKELAHQKAEAAKEKARMARVAAEEARKKAAEQKRLAKEQKKKEAAAKRAEQKRMAELKRQQKKEEKAQRLAEAKRKREEEKKQREAEKAAKVAARKAALAAKKEEAARKREEAARKRADQKRLAREKAESENAKKRIAKELVKAEKERQAAEAARKEAIAQEEAAKKDAAVEESRRLAAQQQLEAMAKQIEAERAQQEQLKKEMEAQEQARLARIEREHQAALKEQKKALEDAQREREKTLKEKLEAEKIAKQAAENKLKREKEAKAAAVEQAKAEMAAAEAGAKRAKLEAEVKREANARVSRARAVHQLENRNQQKAMADSMGGEDSEAVSAETILEDLIFYSKSKSATVRYKAVGELVTLGGPAAIAALENRVMNDHNMHVRFLAINGLVSIGTHHSVDVIELALKTAATSNERAVLKNASARLRRRLRQSERGRYER